MTEYEDVRVQLPRLQNNLLRGHPLRKMHLNRDACARGNGFQVWEHLPCVAALCLKLGLGSPLSKVDDSKRVQLCLQALRLIDAEVQRAVRLGRPFEGDEDVAQHTDLLQMDR